MPLQFGMPTGQEVHLKFVDREIMEKVLADTQAKIGFATKVWVACLIESTGLPELELMKKVETIVSQPFPTGMNDKPSWYYLTNDQIRLLKNNL